MHWHLITILFAALALHYEDQGGWLWYSSQAAFLASMAVVNALVRGPDEEQGDTEGDHIIDDISREDCGKTLDKAAPEHTVLDIFTLQRGIDYD